MYSSTKAQLRATLPPELRALPGVPFPHGYRERRRDRRQRYTSIHLSNWVAPLFYFGASGSSVRDELAALAGGALAVLLGNEWVELLLDLEDYDLRNDGWGKILTIRHSGVRDWFTLTAR
jgi:hypothetical protein